MSKLKNKSPGCTAWTLARSNTLEERENDDRVCFHAFLNPYTWSIFSRISVVQRSKSALPSDVKILNHVYFSS